MTTATAEMETQPETDPVTSEPDSGPSYDDINTPVIVMVGVISTIVTICIIFFVQGLTYQWKNSFIRDRSLDTVNKPVLMIVEEQKHNLEGDPAKGVRPIDEAMSEVIAKFGKSASD